MARENQGLQIALIIFVIFTVVLGATTWLFYSKATEMEGKYNTEKAEREKATNAAEAAEGKVKDAGKLISGPGATGGIDEMQRIQKKDMDANGLKPDEVGYTQLVKNLTDSLHDKNEELKSKNDEIAKWMVKYKEREESVAPQIKNFREGMDKAGKELSDATQNFSTRRESVEKLAADTQSKLQSTRKADTTEIEKNKDEIKKLEAALAKTQESLGQKSQTIANMTRTVVDHPDGEIRWVNQKSGLVWINVGRADGLQPLMTFSVYPADVSDLSKGARKGSIEVTQLLGEHMAEARITDDTISDPFMPGDKIDTALWNPGERLHFALAGLMDINGDNRNDLELVKNLVAMNNGIVDCYEDEQGRVHGLDNISINTRFLVLGDMSKEGANTAALAAGQAKIFDEAKNRGVQTISLQELLQRMGYKAPVSTKPTGEPSSLRNQPKGGIEPRTKSLETFPTRKPAPAANGGAY